MRKVLIIAAIVLLVYLVGGWFFGSLLGLAGASLWIFRIAFWLIGLIAAAFVIWFFWKKDRQQNAEKLSLEQAGGDEIQSLLREAAARLPKSHGTFGTLPVVFVLGEARSAKTSTILHSGLDPELLAGQVYQDSDVVPTRTANIWYAKGAILVEAAGKFLDDTRIWARIAGGLQPRGLGSALSRTSTPPSAALVTIDAETLLQPGAAESLGASARHLRARLVDISQTLGVQLPVYVLFTRTDRVPFFAEFTRNFTEKEAAQILGDTLPMHNDPAGVYAEQETGRLTAAFEQIFRNLSNLRPGVLAREFDPANLPPAYEFPRELRKVRTQLVQFLVDLCRPSQLTVSPFLRGFYFSGVRPVVVTEVARPTPSPVRATQHQPAEGATGMFRLDPAAQFGGAPAPASEAISRRVPQWVFLGHFFNYLVLADRSAQSASGASTKTSLLRRILLASACALCLLYSIALIVSYTRNHAVAEAVRDAGSRVQAAGTTGASVDSLRRLESLRQSLVTLIAYHREGAPLSFHWSLDTVDEVYPLARRIYFDNFQKALLTQTQSILVDSMSSLPAVPGPDYGPTYDSLKAYLITTSNPDKSTRAFLSPVLTNRWSSAQKADGERLQLAQKQFDFYADELKEGNPFSSTNDTGAIEKARRYLNQFGGVERVYAAMLADASKSTQPVNFNRKFPGSAETVVDSYEVPGAFTKAGWDLMRKSLQNPDRYFSGEQWVLGNQATAQIDRGQLTTQLAPRYYADFTKQWRAYLKSAAVVRYGNVRDAAKKLNVTSGNQSTLLALFSVASQNTAVDIPEVAALFQPVQAVVPPQSVDRFVAAPNQAYMNALLQLQTSLDAAAQAPDLNDQVVAPTLANAASARIAAKQVAQTFRIDPDAHIDGVVEKLMEDPITYAEALLRRLGPDELNGKGKDVCGQYRKLLAKYPFNPNVSAPPATEAEVNGIFRPPDGAVWAFYESSLKKFLVKQGNQYVPAPGATGITLSPAYVKFFNDVAAFSDAWYAGGAQDPHFTYTLKPVPADGIQTVGLQIDGQSLSYSGGTATPKQFTWQAKDQNEAKATVRFGGGPELAWSNNQGLWSVFQFFAKAETSHPSGDAEALEWIIRIGKDPVTLPGGKPLTVRFELSMPGAPPVFQKGYLSRLGCVADVAK